MQQIQQHQGVHYIFDAHELHQQLHYTTLATTQYAIQVLILP